MLGKWKKLATTSRGLQITKAIAAEPMNDDINSINEETPNKSN